MLSGSQPFVKPLPGLTFAPLNRGLKGKKWSTKNTKKHEEHDDFCRYALCLLWFVVSFVLQKKAAHY